MPSAFTPLRLRPFRRLLTAYFVGRSGDWFGGIALSVVVLHATGSAVAVAALWMFTSLVPGLLAPALMSALAGRAMARIIVSARAIEGALFAMLALAATAGAPVEVILGLALVDGVLNVIASGLTKAAVVCVSRPHDLHAQANALVNVAFTISFAAGPALAGILIGAFGPAVALALDAASFLVAALAALAAGPLDPIEPPPTTSVDTFRSRLGRLWARPKLRVLLIAAGLSGVFFSLIIPVELLFVTRTLGGTTAAFGVVLTAWGVGAVLGGGLLMRLVRIDGVPLLAAAFAAMIVSYLGMGAAASIPVVVAFSLLGGIGNGLEGGLLLTLMQAEAADHEQAALGCLVESLQQVGPGLGYLLGGLLAAADSPRAVYLAAALGGIVALAFISSTLVAPGRRPAAASV